MADPHGCLYFHTLSRRLYAVSFRFRKVNKLQRLRNNTALGVLCVVYTQNCQLISTD